jgi:hypothetical protein
MARYRLDAEGPLEPAGERMNRRRRRPPVGIACVAATLAGCAGHKPIPPSSVPPAIQVPGTAVLTRELHGAGVQIYECRPSAPGAPQFAWSLQAPAADLADRSGKDVGRHYEGPTWEANDGSKVVGELVARDPGPVPSAIPWLLLRAKSTAGKGMFAKVQFIQRLDTVGGQPPQTGCDSAHSGQRTRVAYSAEYYFYSARR